MRGTTPTELIKVIATAHRAFEPTISVDGRCARSIKAAILSVPSTAPAEMIRRRTRGSRSAQRCLLTTPLCARHPNHGKPRPDECRSNGAVYGSCEFEVSVPRRFDAASSVEGGDHVPDE